MNNYFATVARGLEAIAAQELAQLGAKNIRPDFTGIHFQGNKALLYRVNLWARTIFRVLVPIAEVKSYNAQQLYRSVQKLDWSEYLQPNMSIAVNCTGKNNNLNHTHFTALQIKNAIVDWQRNKYGERSHVDVANPDLLINAHIRKNQCILSLDSSGSSLHRRGYRPAMGMAPLKETLAAALITMSEWTPDLPFLDPLCGSGTLAIESALKALNIAPGLYRQHRDSSKRRGVQAEGAVGELGSPTLDPRPGVSPGDSPSGNLAESRGQQFGFQTWLDFDEPLWQQIRQEAEASKLSELSAPIMGSDRDFDIIEQAKLNAQNCGLEAQVQFQPRELSQIEAPADKGIIICNPPYGQRIGNTEELGALYKLLGDIFKQRFTGWTAYVLTGNKELSKKIGLRTSRRLPVYNGSLPCTLLKYELY